MRTTLPLSAYSLAESELVTKPSKIRRRECLCKDVRGVKFRPYTVHADFARLDTIPNVVVAYIDVLDTSVERGITSKNKSTVIVAL